MKLGRKPSAAVVAPITDVYLKTDPGQGFTPIDRIVGDAGNFRTVGPVLAATSGDRTFKRARIPLRPFAADSSAIGKTLFLAIINAATSVVVDRRTLKIAAGMTEAVFAGPFTIPAGQQYAYVYGIEEGDWNTYLFLFYGHGAPYAAPYSNVVSLYSDSVAPQIGQGWGTSSMTGKHRPILCEADGVTKNVHGPLDPSDFPVVTSGDQLVAGQVALLDDGVSVPRLMRKRLNGDLVPVGLPAVDSASLTGTGAPGAPLGAAVTPARLYDTERRVRATVGGEALSPLRRFAGKVRRGEAVNVLLVGSSSLTLAGASGAAATFEPQFTAALRAAFPSVTFNVTNRGVGGYRLANLEAEFNDSLAVGADLTVVVIGLNDATTDGAAGLAAFRLRYEAFTRVLARNGSDVIAVDAQIWSGETEVHRQYNAAVRDAATAAGVAFYGRRDMQAQAIARGEYTQAQLIAPDGLHYQDAGHALWASSMAATVVSGVRQHGDESRAHRLEFSAAEPPVVLPVPSRQVYRAAGSTPDVLYDRFALAAGQVGVISALWRGTGVRWLPFEGGAHGNLAQVRYRIDEGAWTVLPRPWVDGAGNLRGGAWTLAQGLTDTTHLVEVECTAAASGALEVFHSGFEVLVPGDTAAIGSSLAAGGRMLVAQGLGVTPTGGLTLNVAMGQLLLQGRTVPARIGAAAGQTLTLGAAHASLPRVDLVYHSWDGLRVLGGTPAASPVAPVLPHEAVLLAEVLVPAGASAVGAITDRRRLIGAATGGTLPPLVRTATGQTTTRTETFTTDVVASGAVAPVAGYVGNVNNPAAPTYDATNQRLVYSDAVNMPHVWAFTGPRLTRLDYTAEVTLVEDFTSSGIQHLGLWVQCGPLSAANGYRLAHINSEWSISKFVDGTEQSLTLTSGSRGWGRLTVGTAYAVRLTIDFATGQGAVYIEGVQLCTWVDKTFQVGAAGGFSYGCTAAWDNIRTVALDAPRVTGLAAGMGLRSLTGARDAAIEVPSPGARLDVVTAEGAVRAAAWLLPGEVWAYQGGS